MRILRSALEVVQFVAARIGNARAGVPSLPSAHDLLKARWIAEYLEPGDRVLDVGAGGGSRLRDLSVFLPGIRGTGLEIGDVQPLENRLPFGDDVELESFDGRAIPFEDDGFDVALICYVLHHLSEAQCERTLREMIRVTKRRIILLEDSLPRFGVAYRVRNWAHIARTNLAYSARSDDFRTVDTGGFKTHEEWSEYLQRIEGVERVECVPLTPISRYAHHTMFVVHLGSVQR